MDTVKTRHKPKRDMSLARERASTSSELRSGVKEQDSEQNRQLVKRKMNELRTKITNQF